MKKTYIVISIVAFLGIALFYLLFVGVAKCAGPDEIECPNYFTCHLPDFKGPTLVAESGRCVLNPFTEIETTPDCNPPSGAPPTWEAPYECLLR